MEKGLRNAKKEYATALQALEHISDDIHRRRKRNKLNEALASMPREEGVGAESDDETRKIEAELRFHGDLVLGETVDGLDQNEKSDLRLNNVLSDGEEDIDSDHDGVISGKINSRGERPSVSGSEGNNRDDVFSDIDLS